MRGIKIKNSQVKKFVKNSTLLTFLNILSGIFGMASQIVIARYLGPAEMAIFALLFAISNFMCVPLSALNLFFCRLTAILTQEGKWQDIRLKAFAIQRNFSLYGIYLAFGAVLADITFFVIFENTHYSYFSVLVLIFVFQFFSSVNLGVIQGIQRFDLSSLANFVSFASRFAFSFAFVYLGFSVFGGLMGVLSSAIILFILSSKICNRIFKVKQSDKPQLTIDLGDQSLGEMIKSYITFTVFINLDVIVAPFWLHQEEAGQYAAAAAIAKALLYLPTSISLALFPIMTKRNGATQSNTGNIVLTLSVVLLLLSLTLGVTAIYFIGEFFTAFTLGRFYPKSSQIIFLVCLSLSPQAIIYFIEHCYLSEGTSIFKRCFLGGLFCLIFSLFVLEATTENLIASMGAMNVVSLLILIYFTVIKSNKRKISF